MKKKLIVAAILLTGMNSNLFAQQKPVNASSYTNNGIERPKIIVGLVIDQMRWDYLYRYYNLYGNGGFKRLLQKGYSYENMFIPYAPPVTAAGHASLYTGSVPAIHGIVGNDWEEKDSAYSMYCTSDQSVNSVGTFSKQGKMSPRNLLTTTIGDELRLATNFKSRVFGIAFKDRGGIIPAGHSANAAYWFDDSTGNWISSTYYMNNLPAWVSQYNGLRLTDSLMHLDWNLLYDKKVYDQSTADDNEFERTLRHEKQVTFPHVYKDQVGRNYYSIRESPMGNTFTFDFAKQLVSNEQLGKNGQTDMLCVSLSSPDYIGHRMGPNSMEMEDTYLRIDKELEDFLNFLDKNFGEKGYLFFLSADHGAPQVPAFMKANKLPGGSLKKADLKAALNAYCKKEFAADGLIKSIHEYQVYLNHRLIDSLQLDEKTIKNKLVSFLKNYPEVVNAFDYADFYKVILPKAIKEMFTNGYYDKRSGDIQYILKSQYTDQLTTGTEHGAMYAYDTHIPLLWLGWKIKPGKTNREVHMTDVAPTISALLKIQVPAGCIGHVLQEVVN